MARYIEQNPVRAKVVKKPEDFPYSSARAHISGVKDETLIEPLFNEQTRADYREFVRGVIPEEEKIPYEQLREQADPGAVTDFLFGCNGN